ncbi:hypothetical protein NFJ02_30g76810 [Pycnococcus provasolii]
MDSGGTGDASLDAAMAHLQSQQGGGFTGGARDMDADTLALYERMRAKYASQLDAGAGLDGAGMERELAAADATLNSAKKISEDFGATRGNTSNWDVKLCMCCQGVGKVAEEYNGRTINKHCTHCDGEGTLRRWIGKGPKPLSGAAKDEVEAETGYRRTARNVDAMESLIATGKLANRSSGKRLSALRRAEAQKLKYQDELSHLRKLLLNDSDPSEAGQERRIARTDYAAALEVHVKALELEVDRLALSRSTRRKLKEQGEPSRNDDTNTNNTETSPEPGRAPAPDVVTEEENDEDALNELDLLD